MREARQKEMLEKYDADKDGKLSDDERRKAFEDMRKAREEARAKADAAAGEKKEEPKKEEPKKEEEKK